MIITIDGPAAAGKTTVARLLASRLGFRYLDSGALYRALAWKMLRLYIGMEDEAAMRQVLQTTRITMSGEKILLDGRDVSRDIRSQEMGELASLLSRRPEVRAWLLPVQRALGGEGDTVAEGRDMGTVVFPKAAHKFYLDAAPEVRAKRRWLELRQKGREALFEDVLGEISTRDQRDTNRELSPLKIPDGAVVVDSSNKTVEEVANLLVQHVRGA